jgi:hypothetical protein
MKKAWIENNRVRDIAPGEPADIYHPDVAVLYDTDIPDDIVAGAELVDGVWINPPPPVFVPPPPSWDFSSIRKHLTLGERVKWDNDKTDTIKTAKLELSYPRNQADTTEVLQLLVDAGDISAASMQKILA